MTKTRFVRRLTAFGASAAITLAIVLSAAHYALPGDVGGQMLVKASVATITP